MFHQLRVWDIKLKVDFMSTYNNSKWYYFNIKLRSGEIVWIPGMVDGHPPIVGADREEAEMIPPCSNVAIEYFPRYFIALCTVVKRPLKK